MLIDKIEKTKQELTRIGYKYKTAEKECVKIHYDFYANTLINSVVEEERIKLKDHWENLKDFWNRGSY